MKSINLTAAVVALGLFSAVQGQQSEIDGDAQAIAARMDEVLRNERGLSQSEVERNLAELEAALRRAAAEQQDAEPFDALAEDGPFEAPAADGYDIGEFATSESRSDDDVLGGEDGDDHAMPYGDDGLFGDDGAVVGFNDGTGTDEPDMGICDAGGQPGLVPGRLGHRRRCRRQQQRRRRLHRRTGHEHLRRRRRTGLVRGVTPAAPECSINPIVANQRSRARPWHGASRGPWRVHGQGARCRAGLPR